MKTTTVSHAKAHLSALLRRVQRGESIVIYSRGKPVARLEPVRPGKDEADEDRLARLEKAGILTRPLRPPDWSFLDRLPLPKLPEEASLLHFLLEERREERR